MIYYEIIIKILLIVLVIIIISVLLIKRFAYFHPSSVFIPYMENYKDIADGNIHGWFVKGENDKIVIICHGNAGNISHRQNIINPINRMGYSVLIFDYAGYGLSKGIPSESQFYQNASAFVNIAMSKYEKDNIIIYGESIGAPVAAYVACKYKLKTLIIDSGLPSIKDYIKSMLPILGFLSFLFPEFNTVGHLSKYNGNVMVMHSRNDEVVPYHITEEIRNHATKIINIDGTHNDRTIPWNDVNEFIISSCNSI